MAIFFETNTPRKLLNAFKKAIDDGHIDTWSYDKEGDFTHTPEQWVHKAWLIPKVIEKERLLLNIVGPTDDTVSTEAYAVYHGRFIEAMLAHCDSLFAEGKASSMPSGDDKVA